MNRDDTLALFAQGKGAWNDWASMMIAKKGELERAGRWVLLEGCGGMKGGNVEVSSWIDDAMADFSQHDFDIKSDFSGFMFPGEALFAKTTFLEASFNDTHFMCAVRFREVTFSGESCFDRSQFYDLVSFEHARFSGVSSFSDTNFSGPALFCEANFLREIRFDSLIFANDSSFRGSKFHEQSIFSNSEFKKQACFDFAKFAREARFERASLRS